LTAVLFCAAVFLASCQNTALDPNGTNNTGEAEDEYLTLSKITIDAVAGLCFGDAAAEPGAVVAAIRLPAWSGPWAVDLPDVEDNDLFEVGDGEAEEPDESAEEGDDDDTALIKNIIIKSGGSALALGPYRIVCRISHEEDAAKVYYRNFNFTVGKFPAPFKKAPVVYPYITAKERNKLTVSWQQPSGSQTFNIYAGTSPTRPAVPVISNMDINTTSKDITDIDDDETDDGLPDGTTYYVWVEAVNAAGTSLSPAAIRTTSAAIPPFFYEADEEGQDFYSWDSFSGEETGKGGMDFYIVEPPNNDRPSGYMKYGGFSIGTSNVGYKGNIVYHASFDPDEAAEKSPHTQVGKWGESLEGKPAGVFIVEYDPPKDFYGQKLAYQGVYYWGVGAIQTVSNGWGPNHSDPIGKVLCYFSNSYGLKSAGKADGKFSGNPETVTAEAAIDRFTLDNMVEFIAFVAIPWYRNYEPYQ
jgi:hypothetical protein